MNFRQIKRKPPISFKNLQTDHIPLHFFNRDLTNVGCGINTISLLTGEHPKQLIKRYKVESLNFRDEKIISHLRRKGFFCHKIDLNPRGFFNNNHYVEKGNVLLVSVRMHSGEGSWGVLFNGRFYHNFEVSTTSDLTFVNLPIMSAYVIWKKEWKKL